MVGRVGVEQSDGEVLLEGPKAGPLRLGQGVEVGAELADNRELPPVLPQAGGDIIVAGDDPAVPRLAPVHRGLGAQPPMNGVRIGEKSRRKKLFVKLYTVWSRHRRLPPVKCSAISFGPRLCEADMAFRHDEKSSGDLVPIDG